jgi:hypothetical protein
MIEIDKMLTYLDSGLDGDFLPDNLEKELLRLTTKGEGVRAYKRCGYEGISIMRFLGFNVLRMIKDDGVEFREYGEELENGQKVWHCYKDDVELLLDQKGRYVCNHKFGCFVKLSVKVYHATKFAWCDERFNDWLTQPVSNKKRMNKIEFCMAIRFGFPCEFDMSHLHKEKKCVNPENIDPESNADNYRRERHTVDECDCETYGLSKCLA